MLLAVSVVIPESSQPSNHRPGMSADELSLRALMEGGRYRVPKIDPIEMSQPVVVVNALQVQCWSKPLGPWSSLLGVEVANVHPCKTLQIQNIEVNLPATLSIFENPICDSAAPSSRRPSSPSEDADNLFAACHPPLHHWLDTFPFPGNGQMHSFPLQVASGGKQTVIFKLAQRDACRQHLPVAVADRERDSNLEQCHAQAFAQSLRGKVPPASLSGDFVSPVDIRWFEMTALDEGQGASAGGEGEESNAVHFMQSTVPIYWKLDKRVGGAEFVVDISGPDTGQLHQPLSLQVLYVAAM
jgi:hypothetical protein